MNGSFLRPEVIIEPLFNQWFALPHLIAPATAAMSVAHKHLPLLRSFLSSPRAHAEAARSPKLAGGPFFDLDASRVPEIQALLARTEQESRPLLEFAKAIEELDQLLAREGTGESIERLYPSVPEPLKGYVELKYDMQHRPSMRLIEGLLYRSPVYREASQGLGLTLLQDDVRPFYVTPRLADAERLVLQAPFRSDAVARLAAARFEPTPLGALQEALGIPASEEARFRSFFTETPPPRRGERFSGPGVRVRYFGHACLLIESRGVSILTDPGMSHEHPASPPRFTYADLPDRIDYALITHAHPDHLSLETLLQLRSRIRTIVVPRSNGGALVDPNMKVLLHNLGFRDVRDLDELEAIEVESGTILGMPFLGEHADLDIRTKLTYAVRLEGKTLLVMGDTNAPEQRVYELLHDVLGEVDALFLGMESEGAPLSWGYGYLFTSPIPRKFDQSRRLNSVSCERAAQMLERLKPRRTYVYSMGREPWMSHVMGIHYTDDSPQMVGSAKLVQHCTERGMHAERPFFQMELHLS